MGCTVSKRASGHRRAFVAPICDDARPMQRVHVVESFPQPVAELFAHLSEHENLEPILGAKVNVLGTLAVFEAVREAQGRVQRLVYASSAAVFGPPEAYPPGRLDDVGRTGFLVPGRHPVGEDQPKEAGRARDGERGGASRARQGRAVQRNADPVGGPHGREA